MDMWSALREGFEQELGTMLEETPALRKALEQLEPEPSGLDLGRAGARAAVAPVLWGVRVGERWDVTRTTEFLGVSRQALYKRLKNGSVLGVRGQGTTWFPTWQFDHASGIVKAVVASLIKAFRGADDDLDPLVIAAWATKPNRFLDDVSPAEWISKDQNDDLVVLAAQRAVAGLAA